MYALSQGKRHQREEKDEEVRPQAPVRHATQVSGVTDTSNTAAKNDRDRRQRVSTAASNSPLSLKQPKTGRPVTTLPDSKMPAQRDTTTRATTTSASPTLQNNVAHTSGKASPPSTSLPPSVRIRTIPPQARRPGAEAVDGPDAGARPTPTPIDISQDDVSSSRRQLVVAAEISPNEDDIEAEIHARVRQQTDAIAAQVQQRIIGEAVQADVMDSTFTRKRRLWITGGVLVIVIGLVVALVVVFVPKDNQTPPSPSTVSNPPPQPSSPPTTGLSSRTSSLHERLSPIFGDLVSDQSTPQFVALYWLAESDPANLPVESTPLSTLQQRFILATLYFATNGESWTQQYNFLTETDICSWNDGALNGVTCDEVDHIRIALEENGLEGSFPTEITKLSNLENLDLGQNAISGTIPESIGDLVFLENLDLSSNSMRGSLPSSLFNLPKLEAINIFGNSDIGGTLPANMGNAANLRSIFFIDNSFTGTIPSTISELESLERVFIAFNLLSGSIPTFEKSVALTQCILNDMRLTGSIPQSIGNLPRLQIFGAGDNQLTGKVPTFAGNTGTFSELWLYGNLLTGIGDFFQSVPTNALKLVQCHQNRFSDAFPTRIGEFTSLRVIDLSDNQLIGSIPTEVGRLPIQKHVSISTDEGTFDVGMNRLIGSLPTELGLLSTADRIDVGDNQLNGTIPRELGNCTNLNELDVSFNRLEGTVPTEIAALPRLATLLVAGNDGITGDLDASFCARPTPFEQIWSDCLRDDVTCSCCDLCCESALASSCEDMGARN